MSDQTMYAADLERKAIVMIHGRGPKPDAASLEWLWRQALSLGLRRDHPELAEALASLTIRFVYYADTAITALPPSAQADYDPALDLADRQRALGALSQLDKARRFKRAGYEALPGKSSLKEFLADVGTPLLRGLGLGRALLTRVIPECGAYWGDDAGLRDDLQRRLLDVLKPLLAADRDVLLISHCFGGIIAYDCLWRLTHDPDHKMDQRLNTWLTLGAPLADDSVRTHLLGHDLSGAARYPGNLLAWHNVAAEDDYLCHDETVGNDFGAMLEQHLLSALEDHLIYNLTVRFGRSNPHSSLGYLAHPKTAGLLADWLRGAPAA